MQLGFENINYKFLTFILRVACSSHKSPYETSETTARNLNSVTFLALLVLCNNNCVFLCQNMYLSFKTYIFKTEDKI